SSFTCRPPPPFRRLSHCCSTVFRVSPPVSRSVMPHPSPSVLQPQRRPIPENKPAPAAATPHTRRTEVQPKHERPDIRPANVLYSCIDRAKRRQCEARCRLQRLQRRRISTLADGVRTVAGLAYPRRRRCRILPTRREFPL